MADTNDLGSPDAAVTYTSYLKIDEILKLQSPLSDGPEHDELLFIIIHQTYELWFKSLLHEMSQAQRTLESGDTHLSLGLLGRVRTIMKTLVVQVDILETMTPLQFSTFRDRLDAASGFQSAQFRKIEAMLSGRAPDQHGIWHSLLNYLASRKHIAAPGEQAMNEMLINVYRHVKMVERTIGAKMGTGGSSGAAYLASTLFKPVFPELWRVRSEF